MVKKLILLCSTAIVFPTAAFAESIGTVATEEQTIVITGSRMNNGVNGVSGGNIRIRGFEGNRIVLTFDGVPLKSVGAEKHSSKTTTLGVSR